MHRRADPEVARVRRPRVVAGVDDTHAGEVRGDELPRAVVAVVVDEQDLVGRRLLREQRGQAFLEVVSAVPVDINFFFFWYGSQMTM